MPAGLQPAPFGHSGTDPCWGDDGTGRRAHPNGCSVGERAVATLGPMPSFDVVSEVDRQEVRNAVDQAQRAVTFVDILTMTRKAMTSDNCSKLMWRSAILRQIE